MKKTKGQMMRKWRTDAGETIAKLSKEIGYAGAYLSQLENDRRPVGGRVFEAYQRRYDKSIGVKINEIHELLMAVFNHRGK